jgi:hypothetical protein
MSDNVKASLATKDQLSGLFEGRAVIKQARWVLWDYDGKFDREVVALKITLDKAQAPIYLSAGAAGGVPSDDGRFLYGQSGVGASSNAGFFLKSVERHGFSPEQLESGDAAVLDGLDAEFKRVEAPTKGQFAKKEGKDSLTYVVMEIFGQSVSAKTKGNGEAGSNLKKKLTGIVSSALEEKSPLKTSILAQKVLKATEGDDDAAALIKLFGKDDFRNGGPWNYDEDAGTFAASE